MSIVKKIFFLFGVFLFSLLFSCKKKDKDNYGPAIVINSPAENRSYNVNDVIQVNASVTDESQITAVSVCLVDEQYYPVHTSLNVPVSSPNMTINTQYALDNIHLESGMYYLSIFATDGKNDSHEYQKISINAIPKIVKKIFVVSHSSNSETNYSFVDSTFSSVIPYHTFPGDYIGSSVSSYFQQIYRCGNYSGSFTGMELETNSVKFNIPANVSSAPYFTGFYNDDKNNFIARFDGTITGYDNVGISSFNAVSASGFYAKKFCFNSGYLIAEEQAALSSTKKLVTFYPTGSSFHECPLSQSVVAFCEKDFENVFVFGNSAGQAVIQLFNRTSNYLWNPYNFVLPAGTILSAIKVDVNTYLIGHSNGTVYKYEYLNSSFTPYLSGFSAIQLKYDLVNNEVYLIEGNRISVFDYPSKTFLRSVNTPETILDVHLMYNR